MRQPAQARQPPVSARRPQPRCRHPPCSGSPRGPPLPPQPLPPAHGARFSPAALVPPLALPRPAPGMLPGILAGMPGSLAGRCELGGSAAGAGARPGQLTGLGAAAVGTRCTPSCPSPPGHGQHHVPSLLRCRARPFLCFARVPALPSPQTRRASLQGVTAPAWRRGCRRGQGSAPRGSGAQCRSGTLSQLSP